MARANLPGHDVLYRKPDQSPLVLALSGFGTAGLRVAAPWSATPAEVWLMAASVSDPLKDLTRLAGLINAAELFARLDEDLQAARTGLIRAAALGVLAALRGHSHVLVALAGTAGEAELYGLAIRLNQLAHEARVDLPLAADLLQGLVAPIDRAVTRLIDRVQEMARELQP